VSDYYGMNSTTFGNDCQSPLSGRSQRRPIEETACHSLHFGESSEMKTISIPPRDQGTPGSTASAESHIISPARPITRTIPFSIPTRWSSLHRRISSGRLCNPSTPRTGTPPHGPCPPAFPAGSGGFAPGETDERGRSRDVHKNINIYLSKIISLYRKNWARLIQKIGACPRLDRRRSIP